MRRHAFHLDTGFTIRASYPDGEKPLGRARGGWAQSRRLIAGCSFAAMGRRDVGLTHEPRATADPFHHTVELVTALHERAGRLARAGAYDTAQQPAATNVHS